MSSRLVQLVTGSNQGSVVAELGPTLLRRSFDLPSRVEHGARLTTMFVTPSG